MNNQSIALKWGQLMQQYGIQDNCPTNKNVSDFKDCARLSHSPEDNVLNMLPNFEYYSKKSKPRKIRANDKNDLQKVCLNCSLSFFKTLEMCLSFIESIPKANLEMMEYTHISKGDILKTDGYASEVEENGHFMLWEFEGVDLKPRFKIHQSIL